MIIIIRNYVKLESKMLFPIRGKIINAFQCSRQKFFENEEVQALNRIMLGKGGYRRNFTIDEVLVSKIIFMSDADVDFDRLCLVETV